MRLAWKQLDLAGNDADAAKALYRSSNNLAVIGNKAYVYGGEAKPREPVDNELWVVDLESESHSVLISLRWLTRVGCGSGGHVEAAQAKIKPAARVGSAMVSSGSKLCLWGGRESKEMTPCNGDLWVYDTEAREPTWECRPIGGDEQETACKAVEERSFHTMAVSGDRLYRQCHRFVKQQDVKELTDHDPHRSPRWMSRCRSFGQPRLCLYHLDYADLDEPPYRSRTWTRWHRPLSSPGRRQTGARQVRRVRRARTRFPVGRLPSRVGHVEFHPHAEQGRRRGTPFGQKRPYAHPRQPAQVGHLRAHVVRGTRTRPGSSRARRSRAIPPRCMGARPSSKAEERREPLRVRFRGDGSGGRDAHGTRVVPGGLVRGGRRQGCRPGWPERSEREVRGLLGR